MRSLQRPNCDTEDISVCRYGERASSRHNGVLARISINEVIGGPASDNKLRTAYTISASPDGLQLRRTSTATSATRPPFGRIPGLSGVIASGRIDMGARQAQHEAEALENELGLGIVSEDEAVKLLAMTREAQPKQP